jgi:hypothetical protein
VKTSLPRRCSVLSLPVVSVVCAVSSSGASRWVVAASERLQRRVKLAFSGSLRGLAPEGRSRACRIHLSETRLPHLDTRSHVDARLQRRESHNALHVTIIIADMQAI